MSGVGATEKGNLFASDAGCPNATLSCLMDLDIDVLLQAQTKSQNHLFIEHVWGMLMPWTPIVDGVEMKGQVHLLFSLPC